MPHCSSHTGRVKAQVMGKTAMDFTPVPVYVCVQVPEELPEPGGLYRTDLRADPSEPDRLLPLQCHRKYHGETPSPGHTLNLLCKGL